jgi:hypothetical protein
MFTSVNAWGLSPGVVRELVRAPGIDDLLMEVYRQLREEYYSYPGLPWQRSWWFDVLHRQRFLIGRLAKLIASRSWPVLPYATPAMFQLACVTPLAFLSDRKVQARLLIRKFPALARLPLADNTARSWYRVGKDRTSPWRGMAARVRTGLSRRVRAGLGLPDQVLNARLFDFNGPGWSGLRERARNQAAHTDAWLDKDLVLQLIPPPSPRVEGNYANRLTTGRRTLVGAVLCCRRYFGEQPLH